MDLVAASALLFRLVMELRVWFPKLDGKWLSLVTLVVGVLLAAGFDVRIAQEVFGKDGVHVVLDFLVSGFILASFGGGIHQALKNRTPSILTGTGGREVLGVIDRTKDR